MTPCELKVYKSALPPQLCSLSTSSVFNPVMVFTMGAISPPGGTTPELQEQLLGSPLLETKLVFKNETI